MAEGGAPRAETLEQLSAACDRALQRLHDPELPYPPSADLVALIEDVRARTDLQLADRRAHTNALFRDANEQIAAAARQVGVDPMPLLCECSAPRCTTIVRMSALDYQGVRANPLWFFNIPEHEVASGAHARVIADHGSYLIVENLGVAAGTAAEIVNGAGPAGSSENGSSHHAPRRRRSGTSPDVRLRSADA